MTIAQVATLIATLGVVYVLLPRIIFPVNKVEGTYLDRLIVGGVWMTALSCAAMYILGTFGMLETFGLIAVWVAAWWYLKGRFRPRGSRSVGERFFAFSDRMESKGVGGAVGESSGTARDHWRRVIRRSMIEARDRFTGPVDIALSLAVVVVLALAAYLRFYRALHHGELVPQDSFLALFWTKSITGGALLKDGTYPQGAYMWMSLLDRFYPYDAYQLTRFAGPLMNSLELVVLYWATSRISRSRAGGLLAVAILGFFAGHPSLLVIWPRQIGSMTQEFGLAFGIVSLYFGSKYVAEKRTQDLMVAASALFVAVTSNTLVIPFMLLSYVAIIVVGVATASFTRQTVTRLVIAGLAAMAAANYFFLLGFIRGISLAQSFTLYDPLGGGTFGGTGADLYALPGAQLFGHAATAQAPAVSPNLIFQIGFVGLIIAFVVGVTRIRRPVGRILMSASLGNAMMMLFFDFVAAKLGLLFRVRMGWITGEIVAIAIGLGVGSLVLVASELLGAGDPLWRRERRDGLVEPKIALVQIGGAVLAAIIFIGVLWPRYNANACLVDSVTNQCQPNFTRSADPSGYPEADSVALKALDRHEDFTTTLVGGPEQFQETANRGFFVEAWVFAKDITYSEAKDPSYEIPIPTNDVYVFAEKVPFVGPQAPVPYGPAQEFYRDVIHRRRIEERILKWSEIYTKFHSDMTVFYEDSDLRVYHLHRTVDVDRADRSPDFKDYRWQPALYFDDDGDITADHVTPNPRVRLPSN